MPLQASLNLSKSFQDIKPRKLLEPASISRNKKHTKRIYLFFLSQILNQKDSLEEDETVCFEH